MLDLKDITYRIAGRELFNGLSAQISAGHRIGLVGRNGTGKSTLFKLILGDIHCDSGTIQQQNDIKIGQVAQEIAALEDTPLEFVLKADKRRHALMEEAETCKDPYRIAEVHHELLEINAYEAPTKAAKILNGLGFPEEDQSKPLHSFSGGWRMRVALAAALFSEPDILLLDEPTNHLDFESTAWLENYLLGYPNTIVLISHDRHVLNKVTNRIFHLSQKKITVYSGNFDTFEKTRKEQMLVQESAVRKQEASRKHIQSFIDRFRAKSSKASLVQSRIKMLEKFEPISLLKDDPIHRLSFPAAEDISPPMITLDQASAGYGDHAVLRNLDMRIDPSDRIALLGKNGNGKTTFAKLIGNTLKELSGEVLHHPKIKIGYFHQHQIDSLDIIETAFTHLSRLMPTAKRETIFAHLGRYGITKEMSEMATGKLSGGEKARLNFALISHTQPNILILDEPTNHLDMESRENLIMAINDFNGAVILISHDRYLLEHTADRYWLVADQKVTPFEGDLNDYSDMVLGKKPKASRSDEIRAKKIAKKNKNADKGGKKKKKNKAGRGDGFIMD